MAWFDLINDTPNLADMPEVASQLCCAVNERWEAIHYNTTAALGAIQWKTPAGLKTYPTPEDFYGTRLARPTDPNDVQTQLIAGIENALAQMIRTPVTAIAADYGKKFSRYVKEDGSDWSTSFSSNELALHDLVIAAGYSWSDYISEEKSRLSSPYIWCMFRDMLKLLRWFYFVPTYEFINTHLLGQRYVSSTFSPPNPLEPYAEAAWDLNNASLHYGPMPGTWSNGFGYEIVGGNDVPSSGNAIQASVYSGATLRITNLTTFRGTCGDMIVNYSVITDALQIPGALTPDTITFDALGQTVVLSSNQNLTSNFTVPAGTVPLGASATYEEAVAISDAIPSSQPFASAQYVPPHAVRLRAFLKLLSIDPVLCDAHATFTYT